MECLDELFRDVVVDDILSHTVCFGIALLVHEIFFVCDFVSELVEHFNAE